MNIASASKGIFSPGKVRSPLSCSTNTNVIAGTGTSGMLYDEDMPPMEKKKTNRLSSSKMRHEKKLKAKIQQDTTQTKFLPDTDTQSLFGGEVADLANCNRFKGMQFTKHHAGKKGTSLITYNTVPERVPGTRNVTRFFPIFCHFYTRFVLEQGR